MKIRNTAALVISAGLMFGLSGCGLIAKNGTAEPYAPSDGVEITGEGVALRNIMLVEASDGESFNLVFTGVNQTSEQARVDIAVAADGAEANAIVDLAPGSTSFGDLSKDEETIVLKLPGLSAGATARTYFKVNGSDNFDQYVPVLDGSLKEYEPLVLSDSELED